MAITTATAAGGEPFAAVPPGNRRRISAVLTGSTSYTTGGDTISPAIFGLTAIDNIILNSPAAGGVRFYTWDAAAKTVKCFDLVAGVLTEEGAATDCSADRVSCTVWGI